MKHLIAARSLFLAATLILTAGFAPAALAQPSVTVVATTGTAVIGGADGLLTFTRAGSTAAALTVNYTLGGTAVKWNDYYQAVLGDMPIFVTIPAGANSTTMTIAARSNSTGANPETATFTLLPDPTYNVGTPSTATITILSASQAAALPSVTVVATTGTAVIGGANGLLTFTRAGSTATALIVNYSLGGTAVKWNDYYQAVLGDMPIFVTIPAGAAYTTMTIAARSNSTGANPETATFTLSASTTYTIGSVSTATITILSAAAVAPPVVSVPPVALTSSLEMDYTGLTQPPVGDNALSVITPTLLELQEINTKAADPAAVSNWNLVNANGNFITPALTQFTVTANGQPVSVVGVGFKRRVLAASVVQYDLRIGNALYLQLATPIGAGQAVVVTNPSGQLWSAATSYTVTTDPLRYSPAIHVNQEGYVPNMPKVAMVGYYLGNLGEMPASGLTSFSIVVASTGATVFQGSLTARPDVGWEYTPMPYQNVLQADFSSLTTPGEYYLVVPGMGASLPFLINDGIAMAWMRTYALGMYFQRSGMAVGLPFTRFAHDADHTAPASIPVPESSFPAMWAAIPTMAVPVNPLQTAPQITSNATSLYPFVNQGTVNVSGGHFDAGDYSKYMIDCAKLVHTLMFTVDCIPGAAALDNLGIPESGDGVPDLLQEAKWEADFIAKMQDADGGFYFGVFPQNRQYENNVSLTNGDDGDPQVVWPKNTSSTAAAVAALAECASSPAFKKAYPAAAAQYLQEATLGWQFLMNAIAKYGQVGSYQEIISNYGNDFLGVDYESWAACEMYLATGNPVYQAQLFAWFPNPSNPATFVWGWEHMSEGYGNAIRSYAFAAISGRLPTSQLNQGYLTLCDNEVAAAGNTALLSWNQNAYGTSFPAELKAIVSAGWYFSLDAASDMAVAYQLNPNPAYLAAIVGNMNYEGGTNPVNVAYITGLGLKRQHTVVSLYANNNPRVLPPDGMPVGNIQSAFEYLPLYGSELSEMSFPSDSTGSIEYPLYDRWSDTWNVTTELVTVNTARSILALSAIVSQTAAASTPWTSGIAQITVPTTAVPLGMPATLSVQTPGFDSSNARIVWEARDQQPIFGSGSTASFSPINNGAQWVEVEVEAPDGRRVSATSTFMANSPVINWVNGALPAGAVTGADGGDSWTWVTSNPTPYSAPADHQSVVAAGLHDHWFNNATATLAISTGDSLFAYVYLDPANPPTEVMLMWTDSTGSAEHRAYWGPNEIPWGVNGTANNYPVGPLPATGQWVRLTVPASAVGLEGSTLTGIRFALFGGRATWDVTGKSSSP
jgi:Glycosyl hydrolase family 9/Cellulase N-terminal ig-like domain